MHASVVLCFCRPRQPDSPGCQSQGCERSWSFCCLKLLLPKYSMLASLRRTPGTFSLLSCLKPLKPSIAWLLRFPSNPLAAVELDRRQGPPGLLRARGAPFLRGGGGDGGRLQEQQRAHRAAGQEHRGDAGRTRGEEEDLRERRV